MAYRGAALLVWDHWHIEPSSICALQCPRCPRSELPDSLLNRQLTLNFFQRQIGDDIVRQIKKITFCGNDGDPIYCRELVEICKWLKQVNPLIALTVITNGSYRPASWWQSLAQTLDHNDELHWSIDGWDDQSNKQYRVNSNWQSIINGINSFKQINQKTYRVWATIGFRFNQTHIETIKQLASSLEFDCFQLTKSTKFGSKYPDAYGNNDQLEPTDSNLISSGYRFERDLLSLSTKIRPNSNLKQLFFVRAQQLKNTKHSGICFIGNKGVFLNSQGEFYPCCWTANRYKHNSNWHGKFNLHQQSFKQIINDEFWTTEFLKFDNLECKTKCTPERLNDTQHTIEW
jgi:MoaA/NifB/PqqE/SkfB family radical SAM enzyme